MAVANLNGPRTYFADGYDSIVIVDNFKSRRGGVTLDVTGYPHDYIRAGHVLIRETSTGEIKPMPLNGTNDGYGTLPENHTYYGILLNTVSKAKPFAGVMFSGTVNPLVGTTAEAKAQGYYDISGILSAVQTAFRAADNDIKFIGDNQ